MTQRFHSMEMLAPKLRIDHRVTARAEEMTVVMVSILVACFCGRGHHHTYETFLCKGIQGIIDRCSRKTRHLTDQCLIHLPRAGVAFAGSQKLENLHPLMGNPHTFCSQLMLYSVHYCNNYKLMSILPVVKGATRICQQEFPLLNSSSVLCTLVPAYVSFERRVCTNSKSRPFYDSCSYRYAILRGSDGQVRG